MEIFMRNVPFTANEVKITLRLAPILHSPAFERYATSPGLLINFKVVLFKNKRNRGLSHSGCGALTLPNRAIGSAFLQHVLVIGVQVDHRTIIFEPSKNDPRSDILGEIQLLPWRDPLILQAEEARTANLSTQVALQDVQFGWLCRDDSFSIEWQWNPWHLGMAHAHNLRFKPETREILVERHTGTVFFTISIRYARIQSIETDGSDGEPCILLTLESPPSFEKGNAQKMQKREKLTHLSDDHAPVAPYTWNALRLVCRSRSHLAEFKRMAEVASLVFHENKHLIVRRMLFSAETLRKKDEWLCGPGLPWLVAFQCEALLRDLLLDTLELLGFRSKIDALVTARGTEHTVQVLRQFGLHLRSLWSREVDETISSCFSQAEAETLHGGTSPLTNPTTNGTFRCLHVSFTPTGMTLRGPFPDMSNRILRKYPDHHDCFLRVTFMDEDRLKFRFDHREVDGPGFIDKRVGGILREGFRLCGRPFEFLAYSQSALKEYTMWFVTPFADRRGSIVNAERIREGVGSGWPRDVRRCPARFAARLSQAFTATEQPVFIEPDQIERMDDIERHGYCFSDGNGSLSQEMADAIHEALQHGSGRANRKKRVPSVVQVRIQGAKGTLSVDPSLSGMMIGLRPSMIKFESRDNSGIEVARSFNKPGKLFLNRPLVMILAGLGVDSKTFLELQRDAIKETEASSRSMKSAARLLETQGLGTAFALPSTLINLHKLGLDWKQQNDPRWNTQDVFTKRSMQYAVNHVLREMKYRARIPVPKSWKLVGVVDVHKVLEPDEIYACVIQGEVSTPEYLYGPVVISKSPTIHPGDIQMAFAIGAPPRESPLQALTNCVVFSQLGDRPLPDKLSGSDLDGDEYDLILLPSLHPPRIFMPGEYPKAPRKTLERSSTIRDVAEFVVDFINNDMLGIIATNFLLIADLEGISHPHCLKLAELHSWAVDFAKSGVPVPQDRIPYPKFRIKPDWHAPELSTGSNLGADYYESKGVLGKLFRDIHLPKLSAASYESREEQRRKKKERVISLEDALERLSLDTGSFDDPISVKLRRRLRPLVDLRPSERTTDSILKVFDHFVAELEHICFSHTLSRKATSRLTEEEVFMGTIVAKSSQPRIRKDAMSGMREESTKLVRSIRQELEGGEDATIAEWANRAWTAWQISITKQSLFGAKSFGWVALRALFDCLKELDGEAH